MATASAGSLWGFPHGPAQREWLSASERLWREHLAFDIDETPGTPLLPLPLAVRPAEGWLPSDVETWRADPLGTERAYHDVPPDGGRSTDAVMRAVSDRLRAALRAEGYGDTLEQLFGTRMCHHFAIGDEARPMEVTVVNMVHSSYCHLPIPVPAAHSSALVAQTFFWRRLQHLGFQQNFAHTSLKVCYIPPLNASHILFHSGRVLETGANNAVMAQIMFECVTLPCLRASGLRRLECQQRSLQNIVATSVLPERRTIQLAQLAWRHQAMVEYNADNFAGAIIRLVRANSTVRGGRPSKVAMLAFGAGPVVCVGTDSLERLWQAYRDVYEMLMANSRLPVGNGGGAPRKRAASAHGGAGAGAGRAAKRPRGEE
jgi:TATA-box binding protein (TBP) (component of TFIID and TFIIIB)